MKKEHFLTYLRNSLSNYNKVLSSNSLSEEDKANMMAIVESLKEVIGAVEQEPEENTEVVDELKTTVSALQDSITAITEKLSQTKKEEETTMTETPNYLQTQNSIHDFCDAIRNSKNGKEFTSNWNACLTQNGITIAEGSEEAYLPAYVQGMIQDKWDRNADWLKDLKHVGAKRYNVRKNDSDQTNANSRAKGFKKGDTKTAQSLTFSAKEVTTQFIFKIQTISIEDEFNDDGSLLNYIVNELVDQILYEEKRAILVGDGRASDATGKITKIEAIAKANSDAWTEVSSVTDGGFLVDDMRAMVDGLHNPNNEPVYVFMNKADLRTLSRVQASSTSTPVYMSIEQVAEQIGATKIITTDLLGGNGATYTAIAMIPNKYVMIGENVLSPVLYTWHEGFTNEDNYRYECAVGGAIEGLKSTAVLKA